MEKKHIGFTEIPQFRDVIRNVTYQSQFQGFDEDNEPILNKNATRPTVTFIGTVKLHGTNSSICATNEETWYQSRKNIVTVDKDNYGFAQFCTTKQESVGKLLTAVALRIIEKDSIICIFGEMCGRGVQSGVSIANLPKMFVIFAVKIVPNEGTSYYIDSTGLNDPDNLIYNINDFQTFGVDIDFNYPEIAQNEFVKLVNEVEKECPVGKALGITEGNITGEGIVWTGYYKNTRRIFKTKGKKHSVTKTKTIAPVDIEKVNSIREFIEYAVTENRMKQAIDEVFGQEEPVIRRMGDFLRWIVKDIVKEEMDTLEENGLLIKDVGRSISNKARPWFQTLLDHNAGLL